MTTVHDIELILERPVIVAEYIGVHKGIETKIVLDYIPLHRVFRLSENDDVMMRGFNMVNALDWFNTVVAHIESGE